VTISWSGDVASLYHNLGGIRGKSNFSFSGNAWISTSERSFVGSYTNGYSYANNTISDGQTTYSQFTVSVPSNAIEASISFYYSVSSESGYDFLNVYIDGVQVVHVSGEVNWTLYQKSLTSGTHTIKFEYTKDGSATRNLDHGYIDDIWFNYTTPWSLSGGSTKAQYRIDGGSWVDYSSTVTVERGTIHLFEARIVNNVGNISATNSLSLTPLISIAATPSTQSGNTNMITVSTTSSIGNQIVLQKWAYGSQSLSYFVSSGTVLTNRELFIRFFQSSKIWLLW
jgi:hypothetical protein